MNMKEQQYVCVLAECGSITRAAKELYISQPALSIYINNLEKSLNVKLFERVGKRFILTYAGERYVEKARAMLRLEEEFEEELKDITGNYTGAHPHRGSDQAQPGCCRPWWRPMSRNSPMWM